MTRLLLLLPLPLRRFPSAVQPHTFRRDISLWKSSRTGIKVSRDILDLKPGSNVHPKPDDIQIGLSIFRSKEPVKYMSLREYLREHAEPGKILTTHKCANEEGSAPTFVQKSLSAFTAFKKFPKIPDGSPVSSKSVHVFQLHFSLPAAPLYVELCLLKAYGALAAGKPVEIQVHVKPKMSTPFLQTVADSIHLRPDVFLASMPMGTEMLIDPYTDFTRTIFWVMGKGKKSNKNFMAAQSSAERQQNWIELEKAEGRYRLWGSGQMMTDLQRLRAIRRAKNSGNVLPDAESSHPAEEGQRNSMEEGSIKQPANPAGQLRPDWEDPNSTRRPLNTTRISNASPRGGQAKKGSRRGKPKREADEGEGGEQENQEMQWWIGR